MNVFLCKMCGGSPKIRPERAARQKRTKRMLAILGAACAAA